MSGLGRLVGSLRQSGARSLSALSSLANVTVSDSNVQVVPVLLRGRQLTTGSSPVLSPVHIEDEPYCRQRQLIALGNRVSEVGCIGHAPDPAAPACALAAQNRPVAQKHWHKLSSVLFLFQIPVIAPDTWIAPNAVVVGDVDLFDRVSQPVQRWIAMCLQLDSFMVCNRFPSGMAACSEAT